MTKHNNVIPNQHFKKKWQFYVKTWFNQPARKVRRRNGGDPLHLRQRAMLLPSPGPLPGPRELAGAPTQPHAAAPGAAGCSARRCSRTAGGGQHCCPEQTAQRRLQPAA